MKQPYRTAVGGRIDRNKPMRFSFDRRILHGFAGDTLASALLANGVHLVGRSFKYHRPRGILSAGSEEPNALVTIDRGVGRVTPNLRATQVELFDGLTAQSQNRFPSLHADVGALAGLAAPLLTAGFYYKSFMWPPSFWKRLYEPAIRRAAGLGKAPQAADADRYLHHYAHCDVLVVGGGAAGLAAALGASATGARVILCDEQPELGGALLHEPGVTIDGWPASEWVREVVASLDRDITLLPRTTAFGWYPGGMLGLVQRLTDHLAEPAPGLPRERLWHVRAGRVVLATGALERPLIFPGNDRPGVMLAEAARTYLHRYGVSVGHVVVITTAGDSAYQTAADLHAAGVRIAAIVDIRPAPSDQAARAAQACGIPVHLNTMVERAEGRSHVHSAKLTNGQTIPCDTILMSGGWTPCIHLFSQSRGQLEYDAASGAFLPSSGAAGACAGVFDLAASLRDGITAGGCRPRSFQVIGTLPPTSAAPPVSIQAPNRTAFVDFQNDVTTKDLAAASEEGFVSIEHVKRYTTLGLATDQGKTSTMNALSIMAALTSQPIPSIGLTTFRPPYTPVTFGALAGAARQALFAPVRQSPIHPADAILEDVGTWKRARCFPKDGETIDAAVARESLAVRNNVAMLDQSPLGKIEVAGRDAAIFLSRLYTGDYTDLEVGRCRYGLLLGEDGFIRDDGVIARLAADRFHVTTTPTGAEFVLHHMEDYLQSEFAGLEVWLTSITDQWAVIAVHGPRAADTLAPFISDIDVGSMKHMSVRESHIGQITIRLFRVSFSGEVGFEVNLPPDQAPHLWQTLLKRDVTPCGLGAAHLLRAEKGYIIVGHETDGTVTPDDVGLGWTIAGGDFVGRRSLELPDLKRPDRKQLVGLLPVDKAAALQEGAQVIAPEPPNSGRGTIGGNLAIGHVTSAYSSPTLQRTFALALVAGGRALIGTKLTVPTLTGSVEIIVTDPKLLDRPGERLRITPAAEGDFQPIGIAEVSPAPVARPSDVVQLRLLAPTTRLSIRADAAGSTAVGMALGVLLPTVACRSIIVRDRAALWLGPDEWLVVASATESALAAKASKAATGHAASVVDVSNRSHTLEITGKQAAWCLNAFCVLDLHTSAFPVGTCTRTVLGKAPVMLWRIAAEVFHVEIIRSLLPYAWACLEEARLEFAKIQNPP